MFSIILYDVKSVYCMLYVAASTDILIVYVFVGQARKNHNSLKIKVLLAGLYHLCYRPDTKTAQKIKSSSPACSSNIRERKRHLLAAT